MDLIATTIVSERRSYGKLLYDENFCKELVKEQVHLFLLIVVSRHIHVCKCCYMSTGSLILMFSA